MPENLVRKKWTEIKDANQMAAIFNVPKPLVWFSLKHLGLI
jgi:hypothetical protein